MFMKFYKSIIVLWLLFAGIPVASGWNRPVLEKSNIKSSLKKVADWQINNFKYATTGSLHDYGVDSWTNATLYIGMLEWAKIADDSTYYHWLEDIGSVNDWKIPDNFLNYPKYRMYHADELCIGQFYLNMFDSYQDGKMLQATKERADWIMNNPADSTMNISNKQSWTWCDALFMAPPVYAHLAKMEDNDQYLQFMDKEFKRTSNFLYDSENKLFFRDNSYFEKRESNGEKVFWGRGNGWVAAGLVNILKSLPENSAYRPFYENLFKEFIPRLAELQGKDGFWHASLLDPAAYPSPETSATALITYALAYGVNQGLLDQETYTPVMENSWTSLVSAIDKKGKLGWVQPIGADPKKVTATMTAPYGVGAFLLAGSEIYQIYYTF
jgi:rhamnogalacturonyl hydrolase YesR